MNKYTNDQLKEMADRLITAKDDGDERYFQFIMTLAVITAESPEYIEGMIYEYANYEA